MIGFQVRYDETLNKWQFRAGPESQWSEPLGFMKFGIALQKEVKAEDETEAEKQWSKPIDHTARVKSTVQSLAPVEYEIKGGKVTRIPYDAKERQNQQLLELAALLEMDQ